MLALTDSALARIAVGATRNPPSWPTQWLADIAAKLDPPRAIVRQRERSRRARAARRQARPPAPA
jgi:hypothetical protein